MAARDAILFQTDDKKLMKKIVSEDISFDDTVKFGLVLEQGAKKVEEIRNKSGRREEERVARVDDLEELQLQIRVLQTNSED